jgi:hypothetical protein
MEHTPPTLALSIPPDITAVRARLDRWRQKRPRRARIPEPLWRAATALACQHGAGKIARMLRLDYYALRRRVTTGGESGRASRATPPAFVELLSAVSTPGCECLVELEAPSGARMRIQLRGAASLPDLAALSQSFWHGTP